MYIIPYTTNGLLYTYYQFKFHELILDRILGLHPDISIPILKL